MFLCNSTVYLITVYLISYCYFCYYAIISMYDHNLNSMLLKPLTEYHAISAIKLFAIIFSEMDAIMLFAVLLFT